MNLTETVTNTTDGRSPGHRSKKVPLDTKRVPSDIYGHTDFRELVPAMAKTAQDVLRLIKEEGIELIDLKFTDLHGKWQHLTVCQDLIEPESFTEGLAFDGSSIRGWKAINASDMAMVPDPSTEIGRAHV